MDLIAVALVSFIVLGIALVVRRKFVPAPGLSGVTVNYLIPGEGDEPLMPQEVNAAGINHEGMCGVHRQKLVAKLRRGQTIHLVRLNHPEDANAVALFTEDGNDIGFLTREVAQDIAPRLDASSPVTATIRAVEPFETDRGRRLLGVRLTLVRYRMKRRESD